MATRRDIIIYLMKVYVQRAYLVWADGNTFLYSTDPDHKPMEMGKYSRKEMFGLAKELGYNRIQPAQCPESVLTQALGPKKGRKRAQRQSEAVTVAKEPALDW